MQLIGRYLSPFVRRVATTLELYEMPFENRPLQHTGDDAPALRESNPVGRVPALVLDDGEVIIDSAAILDYLDREVGPERALMPVGGKERNRAMNLTSVATGAAEKGIATVYEVRFRPEEKRHAPWVERCAEQSAGGFAYLESQLDGDWFVGNKMSQADVTTAVAWQFLGMAAKDLKASINAPKLDGLVERMMELPAYSKTLPS
ncbi:MAG: glutathione S-transferase family protein [Gammaproteobacteria bacterium]|nr:glutathione S-transferase family protein [Gammaproteobacteria bacterium]